MNRREYTLQRLRGDIALMQQPHREAVEGHAESIRQILREAGGDKNLVFIALALVSAEQADGIAGDNDES